MTPSSEVPPTPKTEGRPAVEPKKPERIDTLIDLPAQPGPRSRRNSLSDVGKTSTEKPAKPTGLALPQRPAVNRSGSGADLKSGMPSPMIPSNAIE